MTGIDTFMQTTVVIMKPVTLNSAMPTTETITKSLMTKIIYSHAYKDNGDDDQVYYDYGHADCRNDKENDEYNEDVNDDNGHE